LPAEPQSLRLKPVWLTLGVMLLAAVLTVCLIPLKMPAATPVLNDKVLHVGTFVLLTAWFGAIAPGQSARVGAGLLLYGVLIEVLQSFTAYRSAELLDLLADAAGIAAGLLILQTPIKRWPFWLESLLLPERAA